MKRQHLWTTPALIFLLVGLLPPAAQAAIRLTFTEGNTTQVYYTPDSNLAIAPATLGDYSLALDTTVSNYPGSGNLGSLSQTVLVNTTAGSGTAAPLTITAEIIQTVAGLSAGFVSVGDLGAVNSAPLLLFTSPGDMQLKVLTSASGSGGSGAPHLVVNTTVDGTTIGTATDIVGNGSNQTSGTALNTVNGYTLTSQVVISNAAHGITGLAITAASSVTALIPEPMSLAIWCAGACGVALALRWRRKPQAPTAR